MEEQKNIITSESEETVKPTEEIVESKSPVEESVPASDEKSAISKKKRILNGIVLGVQIAFVVLAIVICLVVLLNPNKEGKVSSMGLKLLPVLSGSMDGDKKDSFPKGALVFATTPKDGGATLKEGQIVTFQMIEENSQQLILVTHRIVKIESVDGVPYYTTKGDANPLPDEMKKLPGDILAVYAFHINGLGSALAWVRDGYHFIYVIIIPLGLLLIYNIYLVAQIVVERKMRKAKEAAAERAKEEALASIDEEEIKRRAIEEYLKSQAAAQAAGNSGEKGDTE